MFRGRLFLLIGIFASATFAQGDPPRQPVRISVLNFSVGRHDAVAHELRQALVMALSADANVAVTAVDAEADDAVTAIKKAKGDFIVFGSIEKSGRGIRLAGLVTDGSGRTVGSLKAEGSLKNRFDVEDVICDQVRRLIFAKPATVLVINRRPGEGWSSGGLIDPDSKHTPWDHPWIDTAAIDSMNKLRYGNVSPFGADASCGLGFGNLGFGLGWAAGFGWGGGFGNTYNTGSAGLPR